MFKGLFTVSFFTLTGISALLLGCQQSHDGSIHTLETATVKAIPEPKPDLSTLCQNLEQKMAQVDHTRTVFALEQIHQDLRVCLPLLDYSQQKKLMRASDQMYQRFLHVERTPEQQQAFERYALEMAQYPTVHQQHFEQMHIRDRYLVKHKNQSFIELADNDQQQLHYRRSPDYLSRVFAPYLPEADQRWIEQQATQAGKASSQTN